MAAHDSLQSKTITVFSADPGLRGRLSERLRALGRYQVSEAEPEALLSNAQRQTAELLVLDVGDGKLLDDPRLAMAREQLEKRPFLVISQALPPEHVRAIVRLQAADWLQAPFSDDDFVAGLVRVEGSLAGATCNVSTFIGAAGGVGATTMALSAAYHLARKAQAGDVAVVDLDFQSASCSAYLNLSKPFDLDGVLAAPDRLDTELLDLIKLERKPNLAIYSFERPDLFFSPAASAFVLRLLDQIALKYREVVIDLPNLSTPWFDEVVRSSDRVFAVLESNVPGLRQGRLLLKRIRALRSDPASIVPIVNKTTLRLFGNPIARGDISRMLDERRFHVVGRDDELAGEALNRALVLAEVAGNARVVKNANALFRETFREKK
jgi:pilus assembly protein CpaE